MPGDRLGWPSSACALEWQNEQRGILSEWLAVVATFHRVVVVDERGRIRQVLHYPCDYLSPAGICCGTTNVELATTDDDELFWMLQWDVVRATQ